MPMIRWLFARTANQGAMTQTIVATHPKLKNISGRYFSDFCINVLCNSTCIWCDVNNPPGMTASKEAHDSDLTKWLIEESDKMIQAAVHN